MQIGVSSEIGKLEGVIIHTPGVEVENVTPLNVERALYSDLLNLTVAKKEYSQFQKVLESVTKTFQVKQLLVDTLKIPDARTKLIKNICDNENITELQDSFLKWNSEKLADGLIEGIPLTKNTLTKFMSNERYALQPLHNFFFTRDASVTINNKVLISRMANIVRRREALIMDAIFQFHPEFKTSTYNLLDAPAANLQNANIEGGDILVASENLLIIGMGPRTTSQGIDQVLGLLKTNPGVFHVIVQELPQTPESFIHLDMVFTILDQDKCMIYKPVVLNQHDFETVYIKIDNGKVAKIREVTDILTIMRILGHDLKPLLCGGNTDEWIQEREQWHSGTNFFAVEPGKLLGYGRNVHTLEELNRNGYEIITAAEITSGNKAIKDYSKLIITIEGAELSRGGGGCRCMTMPVKRQQV